MLFRRAKDLVDVYAITHCASVNTSDIFEIFRKNPDHVVGTFEEFYKRRQDVEHAYEKLKGMENKPLFDQVYSYLKNFLQPFMDKDITPKSWNSDKLIWEEPRLKILTGQK